MWPQHLGYSSVKVSLMIWRKVHMAHMMHWSSCSTIAPWNFCSDPQPWKSFESKEKQKFDVEAVKTLIPFATAYLAEEGFLALTNVKMKWNALQKVICSMKGVKLSITSGHDKNFFALYARLIGSRLIHKSAYTAEWKVKMNGPQLTWPSIQVSLPSPGSREALKSPPRRKYVCPITYCSQLHNALLNFNSGPASMTFLSVTIYPRDAMLARVFAIATCLSVRPSVCPSATRRYCA